MINVTFVKLHKLKASSLLEVLVAATITSVTLVSIIGVMMYSINRTAQARYQDQALALSQDMMELFLKERVVSGWRSFFDLMSHTGKRFCTQNLGDGDPLNDQLIECGQDSFDEITLDDTTFKRYAKVKDYNTVDSYVTVEVVTIWDGGKIGLRQASLKRQFRRTD